ncbi:phage holin family protein [Ancylobacter lacus]|uniref:phage holin family protein n=1 Tax=Ancylobacter lacus TaxID=2579970 RepID=UPI001BCEC055|nr:phage holin family protein [Ancylobacter lacus]MBS7539692.1 phage holin family protein [Ancylobacter lacus]
MLHFVLGLVGVELRRTARRAAAVGLLFAIGGLLLGVAVFGLLAAAFIALAEAYGPLHAALLVAAIAFVPAVILLVIGFFTLRRPIRTRSPLAALATGVMPAAPPPGAPVTPLAGTARSSSPLRAGTIVGIAVSALIAGAVLGRRI